MIYKLMMLSYLAATLLYAVGLVGALRGSDKTTKALSWAGLAAIVAGLLLGVGMMVAAWIEMGQPPFRTLYQSLIFFSVTTAIVFLFTGRRSVFLGLGTGLFVIAILGYGYLQRDTRAVYLPPALQSGWFVPHVVVYFLGYSALFLSFIASILHLIFPKPRELKSARLLGLVGFNFNALAYRSIIFGFAMISAGLIMGALWAKFAWGDWWSWDPKENWALITWLVYAAYLHLRFIPGIGGKALAWVSIIGFLVMMFTYLGVNYLPVAENTLHSYQNEYMKK